MAGDVGLSLAETKPLLARLQQAMDSGQDRKRDTCRLLRAFAGATLSNHVGSAVTRDWGYGTTRAKG